MPPETTKPITPPNPARAWQAATRVPLDPARHLDLEADALLQQGHHARAELLAHRAAALRGWYA